MQFIRQFLHPGTGIVYGCPQLARPSNKMPARTDNDFQAAGWRSDTTDKQLGGGSQRTSTTGRPGDGN